MSELKLKTARGSLVFAALTFGMRPFSMILSIILARLLTPEDFGLVALAMILFNTANLFTDVGMKSAIVQSREDINKTAYYSFVIVMAASVVFTVLTIVLAAPLASILGGSEQLVLIIRWMSIYILLDGLWIIPEALLRRDLKFKQVGLSMIPSELLSSVIAIILALSGYGVWSIVIGTLSSQVFRIAMIWYYRRPWIWLRPQKWDKEILRSLLGYGVPTMSSGGLRYFQDQVDTWIVGRSLGPAAVGLYSKAFNLTTRLSGMLTYSLFGTVLFPSYTKIVDDKPRLARAYLKSTKMVFLMIVPLSVGLAIVAPVLVPALLGEQWLEMITVWQLFSLYGLTRPISTNSSPIFMAVGQPQRNMSASIVLLVVMLPLLLLLIGPYGIEGAAIAVSVASLIAMLFNVFQLNQILPGTARQTFLQSLPFLLAGLLMAVGVYLLQGPIIAFSGGPNILALVLITLLSAVIYTVAILALQRSLVIETYELVIKSLRFDQRWPRLLPAHSRTIK